MSTESQNHGEQIAIENERRTNQYHANAIEALYGTQTKSPQTVSSDVRGDKPSGVRATKETVATVGSIS